MGLPQPWPTPDHSCRWMLFSSLLPAFRLQRFFRRDGEAVGCTCWEGSLDPSEAPGPSLQRGFQPIRCAYGGRLLLIHIYIYKYTW